MVMLKGTWADILPGRNIFSPDERQSKTRLSLSQMRVTSLRVVGRVHQLLGRPDLVLGDLGQFASLVLLHLLLGGLQLGGSDEEVEGVGGQEEMLGSAPIRALVIARTVQVDLGR